MTELELLREQLDNILRANELLVLQHETQGYDAKQIHAYIEGRLAGLDSVNKTMETKIT